MAASVLVRSIPSVYPSFGEATICRRQWRKTERRLAQFLASEQSSRELRVAVVTAFESATAEARTIVTPYLAQLVREKAPDDATCLAAARALQALVGNEARAVIGERADRSSEPLRTHLLALIATPTGSLADG